MSKSSGQSVGQANRIVWITLALVSVGCGTETPTEPPADTGGTSSASGGTLASGGNVGSGGSATGGVSPSTGGNVVGTGGTAVGTGGKATGGVTTGGTPSGGTAMGGTATGGKATGGTATGGTATGGTGGGCSVAPVTPNATQQTKNLLCYLYSQYKNHVLTGQQEGNWSANPTDISWIYSTTGKYPAVLGSDFMYRDGVSCSSVTPSTTRSIAYWNANGIIMWRYHMSVPVSGSNCTADCYRGVNCAEPTSSSTSTAVICPSASLFTNVLTAGTGENTALNARLDYVAVQINAMKAANVPIILAIYHETQANGWFWWSCNNQTSTNFINLWKYTFNYLTVTKGLNNIVWLMPFSGSPSAAWYPGKAYVDIGGPDQYTQPSASGILTFNASGNWNGAASVLGTTVPITMHETGTAIQPGSAIPSYPWMLFNVWPGYETNTAYNTAASLTQAYNSTYAVTRDKIPSLK
jgi:hypothetical protein